MNKVKEFKAEVTHVLEQFFEPESNIYTVKVDDLEILSTTLHEEAEDCYNSLVKVFQTMNKPAVH